MRRRARIAIGSTLCGFVVVGGVAIPASATGASVLLDEPFTAAPVSSSWVLPAGSDSATNDACLTASANTSLTPIPGCATPGTQPGLQLTPNDFNQEGGVAYSSSVPSSLGLDVRFNTYQYAGDGADGIAFFLAASDPTNHAASPITLGPAGGNLAYAPSGTAGLTHGYLAVGLDAFGNFSNSGYSGTGCTDSNGLISQSVTVRGPGNGAAGYCVINTSQLTSGSLDSPNPIAVPVEVAINPTGTDLTTSTNVTVPAHQYVVVVSPAGGGAVVTEQGTLPNATNLVPNNATWLDANGVPDQLSFGWTASTGASRDFHTISTAHVETLAGAPPALGVTLTDDSGGTATTGQTVTYSVTTTVSNADETQPITLTDTFPNQLTPVAAGLGGTNWSCSINGPTVTCTHSAAGQGTLAAVHMPVTITAAALNLADTVTVGSPDATQGSATDTETYTTAPTATVLSFTGQPVNSQVNAVMKNPDTSTTHVLVAAKVTAGGAVDTSYHGLVTLGFAPGTPGSPQFVVAGSPTSTMTATAQNGVADFSPIVINAVGFGDQLQATANGLTSATSSAFDVNSTQVVCPSGQTCTTTASSPGAVQSAVIQALAGSGAATITASYGGNVAPIHPCTGSSAQILTFSGNRPKLITLTFLIKTPIVFFCYGQPTPFVDITLHKTTYFNPINQDYEGVLPPCLPKATGPCVKALTIKKSVETAVISTNAADPHIIS